MKRIYFRSGTIGIVMVLLLVTGCGGKADSVKLSGEKKDDKIQIGMIFDNFVMERWLRDRDVFVSAAKELGAEVNVQNANGSPEEQVALIEYFIEKKVDVIVIIPVESEPLINAVLKAQEEGIQVISYDRPILGVVSDLYICFDSKQVGTLMAEALASGLTQKDKVLMINGPVTDHNVLEIEEGFLEVMEERGIEVVEVFHAEAWRPEIAASYIRENTDSVSQVKGIMCGNDSFAGQAITALAELRLAGEIAVTGQDADLSACQRIVEGTQTMTVYKSVEKLAFQAAEAAVALANGEEITSDVFLLEDGRKVPCIRLETSAVTVDNMKEIIINSGFHLKEDVYLNRPESME